MLPSPSGRVAVRPGASTAPNSLSPSCTGFIRLASSTYTDCGTPRSRPRSPANARSTSRGLRSSGNTEIGCPFWFSAAVGRNRALKPTWVDNPSGTLIAPPEV